METLFDRISRWKTTGEWETIKDVFTSATTLERYYNIVLFVNAHRAEYGYRYRDLILGNKDFIKRFGHLDLEYLKKAFKIMRKTYSSQFPTCAQLSFWMD